MGGGERLEIAQHLDDFVGRLEKRRGRVGLEVDAEPADLVPVVLEVRSEEHDRAARGSEVDHDRRVVRDQDVRREQKVARVREARDVDEVEVAGKRVDDAPVPVEEDDVVVSQGRAESRQIEERPEPVAVPPVGGGVCRQVAKLSRTPAEAVVEVVPVGRRIEHDSLPLDAEQALHVLRQPLPVRTEQEIRARQPGLEHLSSNREGVLEDRRRDRRRRQHVLPVLRLLAQHSPVRAERRRPVGQRVAEPLEREPVPRLDAGLVGPAQEPARPVVVGNDVAGTGERLVVLPASLAQRDGCLRHPKGLVAHDPEMLEGRAPAHELLVDRARAVGVLAAAEAVVDHRVAQIEHALRRIERAPEPTLVEASPLVVPEIALDGEGHGVAVLGADVVPPEAVLGRDRELVEELIREHGGNGSVARLAALAQRERPGPFRKHPLPHRRHDGGRRHLRLEPTSLVGERGRDAEGLERRGRQHQLVVAGRAPERPRDAQRPLGRPRHIGDHRPERALGDAGPALGRPVQADLPTGKSPRRLRQRVVERERLEPSRDREREVPGHSVALLDVSGLVADVELLEDVLDGKVREKGGGPAVTVDVHRVDERRAAQPAGDVQLRLGARGEAELSLQAEHAVVELTGRDHRPAALNLDRQPARGPEPCPHASSVVELELGERRRIQRRGLRLPALAGGAGRRDHDADAPDSLLPASLALQLSDVKPGDEAGPVEGGNLLGHAARDVRPPNGLGRESQPPAQQGPAPRDHLHPL